MSHVATEWNLFLYFIGYWGSAGLKFGSAGLETYGYVAQRGPAGLRGYGPWVTRYELWVSGAKFGSAGLRFGLSGALRA